MELAFLDDSSEPWNVLPHHNSSDDMDPFLHCSSIPLGNGAKSHFWKDAWHNGETLVGRFPDLFALARRTNSTVKAAMQNGRWMKGLQHLSTPQHLDSFVALWNLKQMVQLSNSVDMISWKLTPDNAYSAASAYKAHIESWSPKPNLAAVWDDKIEGNIQFFLWLMVQNCLWTADRLEQRGWHH
jgi:hypothetical protein